ncbi:MAG TPA: hypothetical protein VFB34_08210 [Chloroflexota bacterium]|nr:hypothetical protein [Chloroflexota bacterium]
MTLSSAYFNVSGGRRHDSADTFRVLSSLRTHSGEQAALYAVSEASAPGPIGARARRLVIDVIQGEYSSRFDLAPAARIRASVEAAHEELRAELNGNIRVGITALVAEDSDLYLLQVPPAQAYVLHGDNLHSINSDSPNETVPFAHALGGNAEPTISLFRDRVEESDIIVLCSSWFAQELSGDELRGAFGADGPDAITKSLFQFARARQARDVTAVALEAQVEAVEADEGEWTVGNGDGAGMSLLDYVDDAVGSLSYVWKTTLEELKPPLTYAAAPRGRSATAVREPEPVAMSSSAMLDPEPPGSDQLPEADEFEPTESTADFRPPSGHEGGTDQLPIVGQSPDWEPGGHQPEQSSFEGLEDPRPYSRSEEHQDAPSRESEIDAVNSFIESTPNLGRVAPPLEAFPEANVRPERIYPGSRTQPPRRPRRLGGTARPADAIRSGSVIQGRRLGGRGGGRGIDLSAVPRAMWLWSAVGVVLVVVIIIAVSLTGGGPAAINYPLKARVHAGNALRSKNPTYETAQIALANEDLVLARTHGFSSREIASAQQAISRAQDHLQGIILVQNATQIATFNQPSASPRILAGGSGNLYVLDRGRRQIYFVPVSGGPPKPVTGAPGAYISGYAWHDPIALTASGNTMLALDNQYHLLLSNGQPPLSAEQLVQPSGGNTRAATTFGGNLYLLDTVNGQVWRYSGTGNSYATTSFGILNADPKLLRRGVSLAIDGDVYVGLAGGRVIKFVGSQRDSSFRVRTPFHILNLTQIYTRPDLSRIFIVDPVLGRIVEIGKHGHYVRTLQFQGSLGTGLLQMTLSADGKTLYFLSGHSLYRVPLPH